MNFDGTPNAMSPLAQIYTTSKSNNEVYNIKEMLQQPDKDKFIEAMNQEVSSMFKEGIWTLVPKKEMLDYYAKEREKGVNIRRQQLMMIWSFKRRRDPQENIIK